MGSIVRIVSQKSQFIGKKTLKKKSKKNRNENLFIYLFLNQSG